MKIFDAYLTGSSIVDGDISLPNIETASESTSSAEFLIVENNIIKKIIMTIGSLTLYLVIAGNVQSATATINWATNKLATGEVIYGTNPENLNLTTGPQDPLVDTLTKYHSFDLVDLGLETTYYFKVKSTTTSETAISDDYFFATSNIFNPVYPINFVSKLLMYNITPTNIDLGNISSNMNISVLAEDTQDEQLTYEVEPILSSNLQLIPITVVDNPYSMQSLIYTFITASTN